MQDRAATLQQVAAKLQAYSSDRASASVMIGFDGFVDSIISVVDQREDAETFSPIPTITRFGEKIHEAAGQSSNYELVVNREKLGGNGPIMANAMAALGFPVTYVGALGLPAPHPVFAEFTSRAKCISIANPGLTDALEFEDGKLMLGKHQTLKQVNWETLCQVVGEQPFQKLIGQSRLVGMVNWTMLLNVEEIWRHLADRILPGLPSSTTRKAIFVDLADPEKRPAKDLLGAIKLLTTFQKHADAVLGMNQKEAEQVAAVLKIDATDDPESAIERIACDIRRSLDIYGVVIHPRTSAAACWLKNGKEISARVTGPRIDIPKILTGGGDHFNAGFCLGWLAGLECKEALYAATATSGYYVSRAASPTLDQLAEYLASAPEPVQ
jgi:sugar/nucleoside kinase (ribokinase family)